MRLNSMVLLVALNTLTGYAWARASSEQYAPGAPRVVTLPQRGPSVTPDGELSMLSPLIGITAGELRNEYSADIQLCTIPFRPYVALRMAEKTYRFDRGSVLREMCGRRTASFALALQSAGGTYGTLTTPGPKQNQELRSAEREYLRQIDETLRGRSRPK